MLPWEHLAVGYLLYTAYVHARYGRPPDGRAALAVAFGTQFPDLVDKPLAWGLGVLPAGVFAHSLFVALPVVFVLWLVTSWFGLPEWGTGFGIGYLSHLLADAMYPVVLGGDPSFAFMLWPVVPYEPVLETGLRGNFSYYIGRYLRFIASSDGFPYLLAEIGLLGSTFFIWARDGTPGLGVLRAILFPNAGRRG